MAQADSSKDTYIKYKAAGSDDKRIHAILKFSTGLKIRWNIMIQGTKSCKGSIDGIEIQAGSFKINLPEVSRTPEKLIKNY
jgi:hypothetical protein